MEVNVYEGRRYFTGWAGLDLFYDTRGVAEDNRGTIILLHGYAEHSERYGEIIDHFTENGYGVYYYDQRGHGRSEGVRADVVRFTDYLKDLGTFVTFVREREKDRKIFIVAHSTGACTAVYYASQNPAVVNGVITTGIYIKDFSEYSPVKKAAAKFLAYVAPLLPLQELADNLGAEDPEVGKRAQEDPLNYHGGVRVRMATHYLRMENMMKPAVSGISDPLLVVHGGADRLSSEESSRMLYESAASADKAMEIVPGVGHEVLHDYRKFESADMILRWIGERLRP